MRPRMAKERRGRSAAGGARRLLFDSLTHVTNDGTWFHTSHDASVSTLLMELEKAAPSRACVVAIHGYNMPNALVIEACAKAPDRLIPVAGLDPALFTSQEAATKELHALRAHGFRAVKIHPTLCNVRLDSAPFDWTMEACERISMPVFLCTVMRGRGYLANCSPIELLYRTFVRHSGVSVLFLHGGLAELLACSDLVRALPNAMIDVSHTMMKYKGSSLELDLRYVFQKLDRRCVIGSDFPEHTPVEVRKRVTQLVKDCSEQQIENIFWRNLTSFLALNDGGPR
jgi:predicted TIM-barrel fold metal-dependent hydrolase